MAENLIWEDPPGFQPSTPQGSIPVQNMEWEDPPGLSSGVSPVPDGGSAPGVRETSGSAEPEATAAPGSGLPSMSELWVSLNAAADQNPAAQFGQELGRLVRAGGERSVQQSKRDLAVMKMETGISDIDTAAQEFATAGQQLDQMRYDAEVEAGLKEFSQIPNTGVMSVGPVLSWMARHPKAVGAMMGEQAVSFATGLAGSAIGAGLGSLVAPGPGTIGGAVAGAGVTSGAQEYANAMTDFLQSKDIDPTNAQQVQGVWNNPEAMAEARAWMLKRGVTVGVIDAFTSFLGARGAGHSVAGTLLKEGAGKTVAAGAINTAIEGAGEGISEGLAQYFTEGQVNYPQAFLEGALGAVGGLGEAAFDTYLAEKERPGPPPSVDDILNAVGGEKLVEESIVTANQAVQEGRTWFGFTDKNNPGPTVVFHTYDEAEAVAGQGDIRKGDFIAVRPEEVQDAVATTVEEATSALTADDPKVWDEYISRVRSVEPELAKKLQTIASQYDADIKSGMIEPKSSLQLTQNLMAKEIAQSPPRKIFVGDRRGRKISPMLRNVTMPGVYTIDTDNNVQRGPMSGATSINLDRYQENLKAVGATVVPTRDFAAPRHAGVVDEALSFASPEAREEFIKGTVSTRERQMLSGQVQWKRFDPRILQDKWRVVGTDTQGATTALNGAIQKISQSEALLGEFSYQKYVTRVLPQDWTVTNNAYLKGVVGPTHDAFSVAMKNWVTTLRTKMGITQNILLIPRERVSGAIFSLDGVPPGMHKIVQNLGRESARDAEAYFWPRSENVVVITYGMPNGIQGYSEAQAYRSVAHEFGHLISWSKYSGAPLEVQMKIYGAYRRFVAANPLTGNAWVEKFRRRWNAGQYWENGFRDADIARWTLANPKGWLSFEEWFAEQTARWAQTSRHPLGLLGRFFKSVAKDVIALLRLTRNKWAGEDFKAEIEMEQFLGSLYSGGSHANWAEQALEAMNYKSKMQMAPAYPNERPLANHPNMANVGAVLDKLLVGSGGGLNFSGPPLSATARNIRADLDSFNKFYDLTINFRQLADRNPHIAELQRFREYLELAQLESSNIMVKAEERVKRWRIRSQEQRDALTNLLFEMDDMTYLTPQERQRNVKRWPTPAEFTAMVQRLKMDRDTLQLYVDIRDDFLMAIKRVEDLQITEALRITDPVARQQAVDNARKLSARLVAAPYFPRTRFGQYALTVRDANGKVEHFELFENKREAEAAFKMANAQSQGNATLSKMPQEVQQFTGVPPWLLDKMMAMPGVTPVQQQWLEQLRYELAPEQSYRKRLLKRKKISGHSFDARRAYAQYFFQHARFFARAKYDMPLREQIDSMRGYSSVPGIDVRKRSMMADFMEGVFKEFVNPSKDWSFFRSMTALWYLGFNAASALVNMTQTVVASAPFLATHFGDVATMTKFMSTTKDLTTYYRRGTIAKSAATDQEMEAISKAVEEGIISESMAAELAAISVGGGLVTNRSEIGENINSGWMKFMQVGMSLFQLTEQWNRRVTFRTAYRLAMDNPTAAWLQDLKIKHFVQYQALVAQGWTERRALAYLAGKETIQQTHYTYDKLSRPKFMRGRKSSLFAFFMFTQSTMYMLWNNKEMLGRYMVIMAFLAGPMGLIPDDAEDIINFIARKLLGKDFNLEREAKKLLKDLMNTDDNSPIPADMILHGIGRYGFGIPAMARLAGATWAPDIDLSKSISLSRVIPGSPTQFLNPGSDWNTAVAKTTESMAGAGFGIPLNIIKAVSATDLEMTDFKRWEGAMPRSLRNAVRAGRLWAEGGERDRRYNQYIEYDRDSPSDIAELVAQGLGFQTLKNTQRWDRNAAEREVQAFYEIRRQMLIDRAFKARFWEKDLEEYKSVMQMIREFNSDAPGPKLKITVDTLKKSFTNRVKRQELTERGINPQVDPAVSAEIRRLYPEAKEVSSRRVH